MKKSENRIFILLLGVIIGFAICTPLSLYTFEEIANNYKTIALFLISLILIIAVLIFILIGFKNSIVKKAFKTESIELTNIGHEIVNSINIASENKNQELLDSAKKVSLQIAGYITYSKTRAWMFRIMISLIAAFAGYLGTVILINQNKLIKEQTQLQEANRRSSLVFLSSNILDKLDDELKSPTNLKRKLSDELIGRISAFTYSLKPYKYLENDELTTRQISPERTQLFLTLLNSNISEKSLSKLFAKSNFNYLDLSGLNLKGMNLSDLKLQYSILDRMTLDSCAIDKVMFNNSSFKNATIKNCTTNELWLDGCELSNTKIINAKNTGGLSFSGSQFDSLFISGSELPTFDITKFDFSKFRFDNVLTKKDFWEGLKSKNQKGMKQFLLRHEEISCMNSKGEKSIKLNKMTKHNNK